MKSERETVTRLGDRDTLTQIFIKTPRAKEMGQRASKEKN